MALQQIVDEQQNDLDRFEETMLASVSAQLKQFKKTRTSSLAVQIDRAHSGLNASHTASNKAHKYRIADLDAVSTQEQLVAQSTAATAEQIAEFASSQKEVSTFSASSVCFNADALYRASLCSSLTYANTWIRQMKNGLPSRLHSSNKAVRSTQTFQHMLSTVSICIVTLANSL